MTPALLAPPAEPTMLAVAIARLDHATMTTLASHATDEEQHEIIGDLAAAYTALRTQQNLTRRGAA